MEHRAWLRAKSFFETRDLGLPADLKTVASSSLETKPTLVIHLTKI